MAEETISTVKAAQRQLWRLTNWDSPNAVILRLYTYPEPTVSPIKYGNWCAQEAARIARDPTRQAAVVKRRQTVALFVNRIASGGEPDEPDELVDAE